MPCKGVFMKKVQSVIIFVFSGLFAPTAYSENPMFYINAYKENINNTVEDAFKKIKDSAAFNVFFTAMLNESKPSQNQQSNTWLMMSLYFDEASVNNVFDNFTALVEQKRVNWNLFLSKSPYARQTPSRTHTQYTKIVNKTMTIALTHCLTEFSTIANLLLPSTPENEGIQSQTTLTDFCTILNKMKTESLQIKELFIRHSLLTGLQNHLFDLLFNKDIPLFKSLIEQLLATPYPSATDNKTVSKLPPTLQPLFKKYFCRFMRYVMINNFFSKECSSPEIRNLFNVLECSIISPTIRYKITQSAIDYLNSGYNHDECVAYLVKRMLLTQLSGDVRIYNKLIAEKEASLQG